MMSQIVSMFQNLEAKDWLNVVLAVIGIIVSGGGLVIAIVQICRMRRTSEEVQKEVMNSQIKIRQTLDTSEIAKALKSLEDAIQSVRDKKLERALMRMMDAEITIENPGLTDVFIADSDKERFKRQKRIYKESMKTIASNLEYITNIDVRMTLDSLVDIRNTMVKIENAIKASVYERTN